MVIKRVGPVSVAKIMGSLYACIGLCIGIVVSLMAMAGAAFGSDSSSMGAFGAVMGVGAIVVMPLLYGIFGFIFTLIGAVIYNLIAGVVGGIELEVN